MPDSQPAQVPPHVLLLFGASRLPEIGRGLGKGIKNFKESTKDADKGDD